MPSQKAYIHKLNVVRFETLLARERNIEKRRTIERLLTEERSLLADAQLREVAPAGIEKH